MESHDTVVQGQAPATGREDVQPLISQAIAEILGIDRSLVQPSSTLLDLGAQSFDFVDLVFRLETTYDIQLPRSFLVPDPYTVESLREAVVQALATARGELGRGGSAPRAR
jgi:acyl carrier protein